MRFPSALIVKTGASIARQAAWAGGIVHAAAGEPERRLDEPRPRQAAVPSPERVEAGRKPRYGAGARPDRVMDELLSERHLQRDGRRTVTRGHVDEAVEEPGLVPVPVDRMAAAEETGHHRLGDARREAGGNRCVGRRTAFLEDLDSGLHRGGMARCDTAWEHGLLP